MRMMNSSSIILEEYCYYVISYLSLVLITQIDLKAIQFISYLASQILLWFLWVSNNYFSLNVIDIRHILITTLLFSLSFLKDSNWSLFTRSSRFFTYSYSFPCQTKFSIYSLCSNHLEISGQWSLWKCNTYLHSFKMDLSTGF